MLGRLRAALGIGPAASAGQSQTLPLDPPVTTDGADGQRFVWADHLQRTDDLPHADWAAVQRWIDGLDAHARPIAWADAERAWLAHLAQALGPNHLLRQDGGVLLLSSLESRAAKVAIDYVVRTRSRVLRVLAGLVSGQDPGQDIVILFDDDAAYYRYVGHFYPDVGEFATSGGMCINAGCVHFVAVKNEQHQLEPVIAHETTHAMLSHLPIPLWLNEGLAVNTERRLCPPPPPTTLSVSAHQMHQRHRAFWTDALVQEFWSGASFGRPDQGQELSYDLARILVEQFSAEWPAFVGFVNAADWSDAGDAAARAHLGMPVGDALAALLERTDAAGCAPRPPAWDHVVADPATARSPA
jgi:hypothetical protein